MEDFRADLLEVDHGLVAVHGVEADLGKEKYART